MPNLTVTLANVYVDDIDAALPFYQRLAGTDEVTRITHEDLLEAIVGPFLLVSGQVQNHPMQTATFIVGSMAEVVDLLSEAGGTFLEGPDPVPAGQRLVAQHADGSIIEYVQLGG